MSAKKQTTKQQGYGTITRTTIKIGKTESKSILKLIERNAITVRTGGITTAERYDKTKN